MSSAQQEQQHTHRERSERAELQHIAERLARQFPELPSDQIVRTIQGRYEQFEGSRIRDFVPVLVEHAARNELTQHA